MKENMKCTCPKCAEEFEVRAVAHMPREQTFSMTLQPKPGAFLSPSVVGRQIASLEELFVAKSKSDGFRCNVGILKLITDENGAIRMDCVITNAPELEE